MTWRPTATIETLKMRADILAKIRHFFAKKNILEIDTPLLCLGTDCNPYIESFKVDNKYLQTSPEFAMKRLLAAGSGSIYQICKAFRQEESGRLHNPEFTILEWYHLGFNHHDLMREVAELFQIMLDFNEPDFISYQALFEEHLQINPHTISVKQLEALANQHELRLSLDDKDDWLNLLLTHLIEPKLCLEKPCFIYDYPASQSALAKIRKAEFPVAERFEVYYKGIELANGFHELNNSAEQQKRFEAQLATRKNNGQTLPTIDNCFVESLDHLPNCAGVAVGLDRLIMLACNKKSIKEVMAFER